MKPHLLFAILSVLTLSAFSQDKWDLRRCVEFALENNISIKQEEIRARLANLDYDESKLSQWPTLNAGISGGYSFGKSENPTTSVFVDNAKFPTVGVSLQSGVTLFNWFARRNLIAANDYSVQAANAGVDKLKDDIALNVALGYLNALLANEQIKIAKVQLEQSQAQLQNTLKLVEAGSLPELNAAQLEAQVATDSSNYVTAQTTANLRLLELRALLNMDAASSFVLDTPPIESIPIEKIADLQPEAVYTLALANLPQQKANDFLYKAAQRNADAAHGAMFPSLRLFGSIGSNYAGIKFPITATSGQYASTALKVSVSGNDYFVQSPVIVQTGTGKAKLWNSLSDNLGQNVGVSLNIPLFNGGQAKTQWKRAQLNVKNQELQNENDNRQLKQDIYTAYANAISALNTYNASLKTLSTNERAFDLATKRYEIGMMSTIDWITSQNNLLRARIDKLISQFDYVFRMKYLEFYKGQGLKL